MATTRKLSNFRQLSLACDSPSPHQKRHPLKKQFSEDIPDFKDPWFDRHGQELRISLSSKNKKEVKNVIDRPPIKIAWSDKNDGLALNEEVIIKKCKEVKRVTSGKLTRHPSLEKDSILNSKQDIAERLRVKTVNKENEKLDVKPNLKIYLAHNTQDFKDNFQQNLSQSQNIDNLDSLDNSQHFLEITQPKYLKPLGSLDQPNAFQIRKNVNNKKLLDSPKVGDQKRPNFSRSNTIVVVPIIEKDKASPGPVTESIEAKPDKANGINVIIRPMTAQSKREKFQKRTNSASQGTPKDQAVNFRPPLIRSSSAPSSKPEKNKFLATKRKVKTIKKINNSHKNDDNLSTNVDTQEWKNAAQTGSEIVTMVSLISPSGSENEEGSDDEVKERPKSVLKRENSIIEETISNGKEDWVNDKETSANGSLRKTIKSVSFQQSSIHAVRSFSASFPGRRGSMAAALALGNNNRNITNEGGKTGVPKTQEKRGTNPSSPDADERVSKRRLVRSSTEETKSSVTWQKVTSQITNKCREIRSPFSVDIRARGSDQNESLESSMKLNLEENGILITPEERIKENNNEKVEEEQKEFSRDTLKEKQCWAMYCKMTEKGINVSYDTILRGMLTPTEYRIRRKTSIAEEMNMLVNSSTDPTLETMSKAQPTGE